MKLSFPIVMNRSRPVGFLFQKIKLAFGWGKRVNKLDVARIVDMCYHKRLFRIFDRDKKCTLRITYDNPRKVFTAKGLGVTVTSETEFTSIVTFRCSEQEAADTIAEIDTKLRRLDKEQRSINDTS